MLDLSQSDPYAGLPKRKYPRADFIDYNCGDYFVTVCTKDKAHYFGYIHGGSMYLSAIGQFVEDNIAATSRHFSDACILNHVVMPNHVHLIVRIENPVYHPDDMSRGNLDKLAEEAIAAGLDPTLVTHHNSRLAVVIGAMKSATTRFARKNNYPFAWQRRFHDHEIRGARDGDYIWNYIDNNVANWASDCFH